MDILLLFAPDGDAPIFLQAPITSILVVATVFVSYRAFNDQTLYWRMMFTPSRIQQHGEWYRFLSAGLIHANWMHLIFNAFVLFEFGKTVEILYRMYFGSLGMILYLALYVLGLVAASTYTFFKHRYHDGYHALGASGAVSGIVFAFILFIPTAELTLIFLPFVKIPAIIMGIGYLLYSSYMSKNGTDNIGHDAHFWGSVWGFVFTGLLKPLLFLEFIAQIKMAFIG
ncbi:MAG: rhomboid family intramembrane serine protease [Aureispira sp.]|nr:rhomboid family intramembrane serine protease [Aureispira sp.]